MTSPGYDFTVGIFEQSCEILEEAKHAGLTGSFGPRGEVSSLNSDTQKSVGAGAVLVHLSAKRDPVPSGCG